MPDQGQSLTLKAASVCNEVRAFVAKSRGAFETDQKVWNQGDCRKRRLPNRDTVCVFGGV